MPLFIIGIALPSSAALLCLSPPRTSSFFRASSEPGPPFCVPVYGQYTGKRDHGRRARIVSPSPAGYNPVSRFVLTLLTLPRLRQIVMAQFLVYHV